MFSIFDSNRLDKTDHPHSSISPYLYPIFSFRVSGLGTSIEMKITQLEVEGESDAGEFVVHS
jgi:hypothetical protein